MHGIKSLIAVTALFAGLALAPAANAQIVVGIGIQPTCSYGYYDYAPYACAPYGFYGPGYFYGGVFLGMGPGPVGATATDGADTASVTAVAEAIAAAAAPWPIAAVMLEAAVAAAQHAAVVVMHATGRWSTIQRVPCLSASRRRRRFTRSSSA